MIQDFDQLIAMKAESMTLVEQHNILTHNVHEFFDAMMPYA